MKRANLISILAGLAGILCLAAGAPWMQGCKAAGRASPATASSVQPAPSAGSTGSTGSGPSARPSATAPADDNASEPLIVCFGDSLTAGYGTDAGESYPDVLQKLLDQQGYRYRVENAGISGNTTKDGLERLGRVIARHPKIVVVEFGGNDGLRGLPVEQAQANLAAIIKRLQASGAEVALAGITLPPDYGSAYIDRFNAMYTTLARQFHVPLLPFILQDVYGVPGDMQNDEVHATAKGNQQVAMNVENLIKPLLKR